jgi:hypothetical protein
MSFSCAHATPPQPGRLLTTATTSAFTLPSAMAAWSARRLEPPPLTNTATFAFALPSLPLAAATVVERRCLLLWMAPAVVTRFFDDAFFMFVTGATRARVEGAADMLMGLFGSL